jgi:hypothetical protein
VMSSEWFNLTKRVFHKIKFLKIPTEWSESEINNQKKNLCNFIHSYIILSLHSFKPFPIPLLTFISAHSSSVFPQKITCSSFSLHSADYSPPPSPMMCPNSRHEKLRTIVHL